jgi:hypothetical protein
LGLEIGLDEETISKLGQDWSLLCEAWVGAELALVRVGGPTTPPALEFKPPRSLVNWSLSRSKKQDDILDFDGIEKQVEKWWQRCTLNGIISANSALEKTWCRRGLGGIVLFLVGLKEWGSRIGGKAEHERWMKVVLEVKSVFEQIPSADRL